MTQTAATARATVLVVDDDPDLRRLMRRTLERWHDVLEADGVAEALALVSQRHVDLVLLDVMMPGTDGLAGCRAIKAASKDYLPVLLVTALGAQDDRNAGLEAGADDFLTKPVDRRELVLRVATFLRLRRQELVIARQLRELQELSALKDDLVSLLVHDLRNPLAAALSSLHFLARAATGEAGEDARLALDGAQKVNQLLDEVVLVRMLEEGSRAPAPETVSIAALVAEAVAPLRAMAAERKVTIDLNAAREVSVALDRQLVRRAVENLVTNAVRYTRQRVQVDVLPLEDGVEVRVTDQGLGVPDDVKPVLFEKYGAVGARLAKARRGVGVGLYLVRLVAAAHGGEVAVEDREGGGTVFRLRLGSLG